MIAHTVVRRSSPAKNQVGEPRRVSNRVLLSEKPAKAAAADNDFLVRPQKMPPDPFNVVDELCKGVGLRARASTMASEVERDDPQAVIQTTIHRVI